MQDLNNSMDDLFRKAINHYPLKICDSRWDALSMKINSKNGKNIPAGKNMWFKFIRSGLLISSLFLSPLILFNFFPALHHTIIKTNYQLRPITRHREPTIIKRNNPGHSDNISEKETALAGPDFTIRKLNLQTISRDFTASDLRTAGTIIPAHLEYSFPLQTQINNEPINSGIHAVTNNKQSLQTLRRDNSSRFYFGIIMGPMFTQARGQKPSNSGFDLGILAGYIISRKLSLETRLVYTRQQFSVGENYFNQNGSSTILSLDGTRNAVQFPVILKYNVLKTSSGHFFATTGLSTAMGIHDQIRVNVGNSSVPPAQHFNAGTANFSPAYLDMSIGYSYAGGKSWNLRVEPYLQMPLKTASGNAVMTTIPNGTLQVLNFGLHIGIIR